MLVKADCISWMTAETKQMQSHGVNSDQMDKRWATMERDSLPGEEGASQPRPYENLNISYVLMMFFTIKTEGRDRLISVTDAMHLTSKNVTLGSPTCRPISCSESHLITRFLNYTLSSPFSRHTCVSPRLIELAALSSRTISDEGVSSSLVAARLIHIFSNL